MRRPLVMICSPAAVMAGWCKLRPRDAGTTSCTVSYPWVRLPGEPWYEVLTRARNCREEMLDRYESHTKNCKICSAALAKNEKKRKRFEVARSIINGGIGASSSTLLGLLVLAMSSDVTVPAALLRVVSKLFVSTVGLSFVISKLDAKNEDEIKEFLFEDYIHAEKN